MPTTTIAIHPKCSELVVTSGIPITTLVGRSSGNNISFLNFTYNDLMMRRKAQVLKYDKLAPVSQKQKYSNAITSGYYSQAKLASLINVSTCPNKISSSSCSGVIGSSMQYYLNPVVPYYQSI